MCDMKNFCDTCHQEINPNFNQLYPLIKKKKDKLKFGDVVTVTLTGIIVRTENEMKYCGEVYKKIYLPDLALNGALFIHSEEEIAKFIK